MTKSSLRTALSTQVVGRTREVELVLAALAADRHVLLEGPPGTGKSTLLRAVAQGLGIGFEFVEGNAELTPARLVGHFDPARVLNDGYDPSIFVDGALVSAMRDGSLLYIEEINRIPEETLNVLITVMSEGELNVPRLGRVVAAHGFRMVAAMNPFDAVGTARISSAVYDRVCRVSMSYQSAEDEIAIVRRNTEGSGVSDAWLEKAVAVVRRTRSHADLRVGSSVRGAVDFAKVAVSLAELREANIENPSVGVDSALVALSGRVRVREGSVRTAEEIVTEIWQDVFGRTEGDANGGKVTAPIGGGHDLPLTKEGDEADQAVAEAGKRTTSRRDLSRHENFENISPEVGELDEVAVDEAMQNSPDEMLGMLADLTGATDPALRALAQQLAGRLMLDIGNRGRTRPHGVGKMEEQAYRPDAGDIDIDASLDAISEARNGIALDPERLRIRGWRKPGTAFCLLLDRSGSMGGKPLATSAVATGAIASRCPEDYSVIAFGKDVVVAKSQDVPKSSERVINDVLTLRGHGTTDLAGALLAGQQQLSRSRAGRRVAILLSDCRATVDGDAEAAAMSMDEVIVIAPAEDHDEAQAFADRIGARIALVNGPSEIPEVLARVLE